MTQEILPDRLAAFDAADWFDCRDSEQLTHSSVEECIEEFFDYVFDKGVPILASIAKYAPIEVAAYIQEPITDAGHRRMAVSLAEQAKEDYAEDFGDLDGDLPNWDKAADEEMAGAIEAAIRSVFRNRGIVGWWCKQVARREYDAAQLEAMLRKHCPEWFEEESAVGSGHP